MLHKILRMDSPVKTLTYGGPQRQYTNIYYITAFYILVHKHILNKIYTSTTICIPIQKC